MNAHLGNGIAAPELYARRALDLECDLAASTANGRNDQLNRSAYAVGQIVGAGLIERSEAEGRLLEAAQASGYVAKDGAPAAKATIRSGLDKGIRSPRDIKTNETHSSIHGAQSRPSHKTSDVTIPDWTPPNKDGKPAFYSIGRDAPKHFEDDLRRHVYWRGDQAVRVKTKKASTPPWIDAYRVRRPSDGAIGWQAKKPDGFVPVPYIGPLGTNDPFAPERVGEILVWAEGEKDVDTLVRNGFLAFTFGSASDVPDCTDLLRGHHVIICVDNDEAGEKSISRKLAAAVGAGSVRVVRFPEAKEGFDASDFFEGGSTAEDFLDRAQAPTKEQTDEPRAATETGAPKKAPDRPTLAYQGQLLPTIRDRLEIAPSLAPASRFPTECLPPIVRDMVLAVAHHTQAPESLCAHSVLSAATLVAQPLANVRIAGQGGSVPLSLYFLAVAESGERKTSCDRLATKAVAAHETRLKEEYETERKRYEAEKHNYDAELKKIKGDKNLGSQDRLARLSFLQEPKEPRAPVLRVREPTLEGLINLLKRGRPSVGIFSSEGGSFIGSHGMNDEAKTRTITGLSMLWDDGAFDRVRVNETTIIKGKRVAVSLAVQPRIAAKLLGDELARNQGFLGRFLVLMPESTIGTRIVRETDPDTDVRISAFAERAAFLLREGEECTDEITPSSIEMEDAAKDLHRAFAQGVEDELGKGKLYHPIQALAQRMAEHVARIAGVLHVFNMKIAADLIPGDTMAAACEVGRFYLAEALRIGSGTVIDSEKMAAKDLVEWIAGREGGLISPRIAQQCGPRSLRADATTMQKRFATLCAAGALELIGPYEIDGKRYREVYRLVQEQLSAEAA